MDKEKNTVRANGTDSAKVIQVIETRSSRGRGTADDLSRQVVQYWSMEGELLAEKDPYTESEKYVPRKKWDADETLYLTETIPLRK